MNTEEFDDFDESLPPSKSQRKRDMADLQTMGQKLVKLNNQQLKTLALPEKLAEAVELAKRLTKHEAIRRQAQYLGRLMREADEETIARIKRYLEALNR